MRHRASAPSGERARPCPCRPRREGWSPRRDRCARPGRSPCTRDSMRLLSAPWRSRAAAILPRRRHDWRLFFDFPFVQARLTREEHSQPVARADHGSPGESHAHRTDGTSAVDPHAAWTGQGAYRRFSFALPGESGPPVSHFANRCSESRSPERNRSAAYLDHHPHRKSHQRTKYGVHDIVIAPDHSGDRDADGEQKERGPCRRRDRQNGKRGRECASRMSTR